MKLPREIISCRCRMEPKLPDPQEDGVDVIGVLLWIGYVLSLAISWAAGIFTLYYLLHPAGMK